jgi:hypothetical protein
MSIELMRANSVDAFSEHGIGDYSKFVTDKDNAFDDIDGGGFIDGESEDVTKGSPPSAQAQKAAQVEHKPEVAMDKPKEQAAAQDAKPKEQTQDNNQSWEFGE